MSVSYWLTSLEERLLSSKSLYIFWWVIQLWLPGKRRLGGGRGDRSSGTGHRFGGRESEGLRGRTGKYLWWEDNICIAQTSSPPHVPLLEPYLISMPSIRCTYQIISSLTRSWLNQYIDRSICPKNSTMWTYVGECICWCQIFCSDIEVGKAGVDGCQASLVEPLSQPSTLSTNLPTNQPN